MYKAEHREIASEVSEEVTQQKEEIIIRMKCNFILQQRNE